MSKESICLPFHFLVSSAQGHLKKAKFSHKAFMQDQELHFLKKFEELASFAIPSHPLYAEQVGEKSVMELETQLEDVRKRIQELEVEFARSSSSSSPIKQRKTRALKLNLPVQKDEAMERFDIHGDAKYESESSGASLSSLLKEDSLQRKEMSDDHSGGEDSTRSGDSSLRSKLAESLKALSPAYSPRRLERSLKAAAKGSCLEQEASLAGQEWLNLRLDGNAESSETYESIDDFDEDSKPKLHPTPVSTKGLEVPVPTKHRQVHIQESIMDAGGRGNASSAGPGMTEFYKKFLGAGTTGKPVEEFRETLKALENLQMEKKEGLIENYTKQKIEEYQQRQEGREKTNRGKEISSSNDPKSNNIEDLNFVRSFVASGWSFLSAEAKQGSLTKPVEVERNVATGNAKSIGKQVQEKRRSSDKSGGFDEGPDHTSSIEKGKNFKEESGKYLEQMKAFRERVDRREEAVQIEKNGMRFAKRQLTDDTSEHSQRKASRALQHKLAEPSTSTTSKKLDVSDLDMLKTEMDSRLNSMMADAELWRKQQSKQVEILVEEKAEKLLNRRLNTVVARTENVLSVVKHELARVLEDVQNVEKARESLQKEQESLKYESGRMRMELQSVREAGLQSRIELENLRKENEEKVEECCQKLSKLRKEGAEMKAQIEGLRSLEKSLSLDRESRKRVAEIVEKDGIATKDELEICRRLLIEGEKEKAVIMDRVEHLSQLYLGGLDDVRAEVSNLKISLDTPSATRGESLLEEMRNRRKKCLQLESVMKDAVEATVKLQEKYNMELEKAKENWNWAMNLQVGEAKGILRDLAEQRQCVSAHSSGRVEGIRLENALLRRIERMEDKVSEFVATVRPPSNDGLIYANVEEHQDAIEKELHRLDEQMQDTLRRLEHAHNNLDDERAVSLRKEVDNLRQKVRDATKSRTLILDKMSEMGRKIRKLEGAQLDLIRSVEEVRTSTSDLEKSASTWLPKYETAASLMKDMDARLGTAESLIKELGNSQAEATKETAEIEEASNNACVTSQVDVQLLHTRVETLEGRVEHVASATFTNLRILDSKVEHYRVGVQSALEGAAMAESKCGVLGAEIVKVFRMLAARNGKLEEHNGIRVPPLSKIDCSIHKVRGACKYCKNAKTDASNEAEVGRYEQVNGQFSPFEDCHYGQRRHAGQIAANIPGKVKGMNAGMAPENLSFIESYAESFYESGRDFKRNQSKSKDLTMEKDEKALASGKPSKRKDNKIDSKGCQRTNIRLEAGRIHVNVCHRVGGANGKRPANVSLQPQKPSF